MPALDAQALANNRMEAIRAFHKTLDMPRAEIDVSGGVDSAVMLMLLAQTLGPDNVTAVYSGIESSPRSFKRAFAVATKAGVKLFELDLNQAVQAIYDEIKRNLTDMYGHGGWANIADRCEKDPTIYGSFRSCIRAPVGRFMNRIMGGGIRHGTGNECEDRWLRFFQKGGDGEVDTNPLAMLSKGEVYQLALVLGVPREIIEAVPTPDLWGVGDDHSDEAELTQLSGGVSWTYSRINVETGEYCKVGTIERMSRFLDSSDSNRASVDREGNAWPISDWLLNAPLDTMSVYAEHLSDRLTQLGLSREHLISAMTWERTTRHKMNPNIPTLGTRPELLDARILTNELPKV